MNPKTESPNFNEDEMLEEYDFSHAKPGKYRGFKGKLIRVLADGTEIVIEATHPTTVGMEDSSE